MSQPRTGSSRHLIVDGPSNYSQPSTASKLEDGLGGTGTAGGGSTIDLVTYDWRTFTTNAQLRYLVTEGTANECIARIASRPSPVTIGLDSEWRPTFAPRIPENPIALVQLACDDEILLVHVSAMQGTVYILLLHAPRICVVANHFYDIKAFPSGLRDLLESAESVKVGVGIQCKWLPSECRSVGY